MNKLEILKRCHLLRELNDEQLNELAELCCTKTFEVGERLTTQGKIQEKLYLIEDGLVGIYLELGPMYKRQLQSAANFEIVGWSAMVRPYRCSASVIAIEKTEVLSFDGKELLDLCFSNPQLGCKISRGLASVISLRLYNAYTQLMGVTSQD